MVHRTLYWNNGTTVIHLNERIHSEYRLLLLLKRMDVIVIGRVLQVQRPITILEQILRS